MTSNPSHSQTAQQKQRPRLRFHLRTLLALMTILCIFMGYNSYLYEQQRKIVRDVSEAGGAARYDYEKSDTGEPNSFGLQGPSWLRRLGLARFHYVVMVDLSKSAITDDNLAQLTGLPMLENLDLSNTQVTSSGLAHIAKMKNLRCLSLWNTRVDDEGLRHLSGLNELYMLLLDGTQVTDKGLVHLEGLTNLEEWLGLARTAVADAGLEQFKGMFKLSNLNLRNTNVTANGAQELQRTLPKASISYGL